MSFRHRSISTWPGPPSSHEASPTYGLNTHKTKRTAILQGNIEAMSSIVKDSASGGKYLASTLLCHIGQPYTLTHLISILFQITQMSGNIPLPVVTAIRAVAFLMKDHVACEVAKLVAKQLMDTLTPCLVDHVIAAIAPQVAQVHTLTDTLTTTLERVEETHKMVEREKDEKENNAQVAAERIEEAADALYSSVEDCQNILKLLTPSLEATQDRINHLSTQIATPPPTSNITPSQPTYSSITAAHLPPTVDRAVGRAAIRTRQVLLDPMHGETLFPPNSTNSEIAKQLEEALTKALR
ncbi:uncharacterized protein EDB91DRAFT_1085076 [Suillus paluster]|uniref:uncharacterized protein n=1 Tax=Suillus paluster TaxID=48578 RepID=UPI001B867670|nr:uncharacterized protein EDB91DRAFT_1085076 [Suillus paluster]KAG1731316.1 hypothetical protein EDB91DRAFT_1085076 [Suillus paluster]